MIVMITMHRHVRTYMTIVITTDYRMGIRHVHQAPSGIIMSGFTVIIKNHRVPSETIMSGEG